MENVHRTPDHAFEGLQDFPYEPNYLEWDGLRTHFVDEGPKDAPVALLLHGEPTWSYLYRKMIPPLLAAGYRCVAPDHIGFGRSDKVTDDNWYVIDRHIERLTGLIEWLDLRDITVFMQDWGGCVSKVVEIGFGASPSGLSFAAVRPRGQGFRQRLADRGFPIHRLCASGFGRKRGAPRGASALFRDTAARSVF